MPDELSPRPPSDGGAGAAYEDRSWAPLPPPPPPPPRRKPSRVALLATAVGVVLIGVAVGVPLGLATRGTSTTSPTATPTSSAGGTAAVHARSLYTAAISAMRASTGFRYVSTSTGSAATQTITGDAGQQDGSQVITITTGGATERFTLLLVAGTVYFQGNVPALEDQLGVPAAKSAGLQGKWISVTGQDGPYSVVAPGIVVADQAQEAGLEPTSGVDIRVAGAPGTRLSGVVPPLQGAPAGTGRMDVVGATHLPAVYVATMSQSGVTTVSTTTFSGWGTAPSVSVPAGPIAWSTLGASAPRGGYGSGGALAPSATPQL